MKEPRCTDVHVLIPSGFACSGFNGFSLFCFYLYLISLESHYQLLGGFILPDACVFLTSRRPYL